MKAVLYIFVLAANCALFGIIFYSQSLSDELRRDVDAVAISLLKAENLITEAHLSAIEMVRRDFYDPEYTEHLQELRTGLAVVENRLVDDEAMAQDLGPVLERLREQIARLEDPLINANDHKTYVAAVRTINFLRERSQNYLDQDISRLKTVQTVSLGLVTFFILLSVASFFLYSRTLNRTIGKLKLSEAKEREANQQLTASRDNLERIVDERTGELQARTSELEMANVKLMRLDELKSAFLTTVSHDIRTPLTSILGFTKLMRRDLSQVQNRKGRAGKAELEKMARTADNLEIIEKEALRLTRLINDFLDLSKIESGRASWNDQEVDMGVLLHESVESIRGQLLDEETDIEADIPAKLPRLRVDPDRITQVLQNLLGNAVKYGQGSPVRLTAGLNGQGVLTVSVADQGPGVPVSDLAHVFDKFYQVDRDTMSNSLKGSGLGLTISREIVEHYGGRIWVDSAPQRGSTFTFTLPV